MMALRRGLAVIVALFLLTGCASEAPPREASAAKLNNLTNVSQLQAAFNQDRGHPRLILLLSPT